MPAGSIVALVAMNALLTAKWVAFSGVSKTVSVPIWSRNAADESPSWSRRDST
ncbi:hypothetical protein PF005_g15033 [Phytophthora fragariae]|uniref:Uncharacterized protein n=2 Tax=Phytophthora TaxID=4783 RepID=A0A6A3YGE1_9STRA|nr:hypothetical protein PF003_g40781 [Phytophthora fragariae]KAE9036058.1 hypothetical protein PR002_g7256 [Phytophthora rubi]KAE8933671.1 hypothetical protein PF009_g16324 [Phytophthora fragariae]KAE9001211.1 hypothetical protein PF011_g13849 [Phytophthora fragariae]KAE9040950.1 hypothetical protein PR001_g6833 [Phytophthora rubi]